MPAYPHAMDFAAEREHALAAIAGLARRAKDAGRLRPGFVLDDLILVLMANSGIYAAPLPPVPQLAPAGLIA